MPKNKQRDINEDEFFGFAKSYLSEAFPNPQRIGCPADSALARMAERATEQDAPLSEHLKQLLSLLQSLPWKFSLN